MSGARPRAAQTSLSIDAAASSSARRRPAMRGDGGTAGVVRSVRTPSKAQLWTPSHMPQSSTMPLSQHAPAGVSTPYTCCHGLCCAVFQWLVVIA